MSIAVVGSRIVEGNGRRKGVHRIYTMTQPLTVAAALERAAGRGTNCIISPVSSSEFSVNLVFQ